METEHFNNRRFPSFGLCIYCGRTPDQVELSDEHIVPLSLGGTGVLMKASCQDCAETTSKLELHLGRTIFGHYRIHANIKTRNPKKRPQSLPATVKIGDALPQELELPIKDHPYFTYLPVWSAPGKLTGAQPKADFGTTELHQFGFVPSHFRELLRLAETDALTFPVQAPIKLDETQFARALAKIAYCTAVTRYGLSGFDHSTIVDFILGRYKFSQYLMGGTSDEVPPPQAGIVHAILFSESVVNGEHVIVSFVRLFANAGIASHGMPVYTVVLGTRNAPLLGL
jgi:HNH endonuclease